MWNPKVGARRAAQVLLCSAFCCSSPQAAQAFGGTSSTSITASTLPLTKSNVEQYAGLFSPSELISLWENAAPAGTPAAAPGVAQIMAAIAYAESAGSATGGPNSDGTYDYGIWQINSSHGFNTQQLLDDAQYNASAAVQVFNGAAEATGNGFSAWSTYLSGAYTQYLSKTGGVISSIPGSTGAIGSSASASAWPAGTQLAIVVIVVLGLGWMLWGAWH